MGFEMIEKSLKMGFRTKAFSCKLVWISRFELGFRIQSITINLMIVLEWIGLKFDLILIED